MMLSASGVPQIASFATDYAPRVSVVMPLYNYAQWVGRAIESVKAQTFTDWELIVVDDGSEDDGAAVAEGYAAKDGRICVYRRPHKGLSTTRNFGYWQARGDYVCVLDPDDQYLPHKLEQQVTYMDARPKVGLTYADAVREDNGQVWTNYEHGEFSFEEFCRRNLIPCQSVMVRRSTLTIVGGAPLDLTFAEDWHLWLRVAAISQVERIPGANYIINVHENQMTQIFEARAKEKARSLAAVDAQAARLLSKRPKRPLRVLHIVHELSRYGLQRVMQSIVQGLDRAHFQPEVCCLRTGPVADELEAAGVPVHWAGKQREVNLDLMVARANLADVVHLHFCGDDLGLPKRIDNPCKIVATNHTYGRPYLRAGYSVNCWRGEAVTEPPAEFAPQISILNGIDFDELETDREGRCEGARPLFLAIARADETKGADHFRKIAAGIFAELPEAGVWLAGARQADPLYEELKAAEEAWQAAGRDFRLVPPMTHSELMRVLSTASVFVLPSRAEAMPLAVIEALYYGVPVVASAVAGVPQLVGSHGSVLPAGDIEGFVGACLSWQGQRNEVAPELTHRYGVANMVRRYEELYRWTAMHMA
jgi:glycosyltransferase involved in cell wall biosynthesis